MNQDEFDDFDVSGESPVTADELIAALHQHDSVLRRFSKSVVNDPALFKSVLSKSRTDEVFFRKAAGAEEETVFYWLSRVRHAAQEYVAYKRLIEYQPISAGWIRELTRISRDIRSIKDVPALFAKVGIVLIFDRQLPGMKLDGAVFKLPSGNPVIAMTLRHARLDNFWFTLIHELAHVFLHLDSLAEPILDDLDSVSESIVELEADRFAKNTFVSKSEWRNCPPKYNLRSEVVEDFARQQGIHPAIVAGMLRYELNRYDLFSSIISAVNTREIIFGHD